jgi:hypothetical protein
VHRGRGLRRILGRKKREGHKEEEEEEKMQE